MKVNLTQNLFIQPDNKALTDQDGNKVLLIDVLASNTYQNAISKNKQEQNLFNRLFDFVHNTIKTENYRVNEKEFEIDLNELQTLERWIFEGNLHSFISRAVINALNNPL